MSDYDSAAAARSRESGRSGSDGPGVRSASAKGRMSVSRVEAASGPGVRAWLVWWLGALSFAYAFFHRVAPSVMVDELMRGFSVGAGVLGNLSAIYFYVYAGLQIPIGVLLDRFGSRRMLTGGAVLAAVGAIVFASAHELWLAYLGRFLIGMGVSVGFVGTLKLAGHWFPANRFGLVLGLTMLVAMAGGVGGQAPLAALVEAVGWRATIGGSAVFGLLLAAATWGVVRDRPPGDISPQPVPRGIVGLKADLTLVLGSRQNWLIALYAVTMSGPMLSYGALWGVPHLMRAYGVERTTAALSVSLLLIGWAIGSPLGGWLSDRTGRRKPAMLFAGLGALAGWLALLYLPGLPLPAAQALIFATGVVSGAMVICMAAAREQAPASVGATVSGLVNTAMVGGGALMQPLVGLLLDAGWDGRMQEGARVYTLDAYHNALLALPASTAIGVVTLLAVRETWCRQHAEPAFASAAGIGR
jgi:MFS family permease